MISAYASGVQRVQTAQRSRLGYEYTLHFALFGLRVQGLGFRV